MDEQIIDKVLPLVGVLLGGIIGLLSPKIAYRYERRKRRVNIKTEIIYYVSLFYGTTKEQVYTSNWIQSCQLNQKLVYHQIKTSVTPDDREFFNNRLSMIRKDIDYTIDKGDRVFNKLLEIESKLHSLIMEVEDMYGTKTYKSINAFIGNLFSKHNDYTLLYLFDYDNLTIDDVKMVYDELPKRIKKRSVEIDHMVKLFMEEVTTILK